MTDPKVFKWFGNPAPDPTHYEMLEFSGSSSGHGFNGSYQYIGQLLKGYNTPYSKQQKRWYFVKTDRVSEVNTDPSFTGWTNHTLEQARVFGGGRVTLVCAHCIGVGARVSAVGVISGNGKKRTPESCCMAVGQKPRTPAKHQTRWQMDVHPPKHGAIGYAPWPSRSPTAALLPLFGSSLHGAG